MINAERKWATPHGSKENSSSSARFAGAKRSNFNTTRFTATRDEVGIMVEIASSFGPDILASPQYFDNLQSNTVRESEKRLIAAILEDAIRCFQDNISAKNGKPKKLLDDAEEWLLKENTDWIFSFRNICELLELDPEYLRAGLMRWKHTRLNPMTQA